MKPPILLPVHYDEHNETINDAKNMVAFHCGWPHGQTYEQKKAKGEWACEVMNKEVSVLVPNVEKSKSRWK